jgi:hypothetical protein
MVLEVAIGLIFVYLLFSLICSALSEIVAWALNLRARTLRGGIETLLRDPSLAALMKQNPKLKGAFDKVSSKWKEKEQSVVTTLYAHPLIQGMIHDDKQPSYIPKHTFAAAFLDMLHSVAAQEAANPGNAMQKLRATLASLPEHSEIRQQLEAVLDDTVTDYQEARARVEKWFDDSMERVSGWYKRRSQAIVLVIAALVVVAGNADTVVIARSLAHDSVLRQGLVTAAEQTVRGGGPVKREEPNAQEALAQLQETQAQLNNLRLPIGWNGNSQATLGKLPDPRRLPEGWQWAGKIIGLLFTILAVSMGAPFWFDILNKVVNARLTGAQPSETQEKKKKKKKGSDKLA